MSSQSVQIWSSTCHDASHTNIGVAYGKGAFKGTKLFSNIFAVENVPHLASCLSNSSDPNHSM